MGNHMDYFILLGEWTKEILFSERFLFYELMFLLGILIPSLIITNL